MKTRIWNPLVFFVLSITCSLSPGTALAQRGIFKPAARSDDAVVPYQSDVAEVHISMIGASSLDAIVDELQPDFNLTSTQALQQAVPDTLNSSESSLSSFKGWLQLSAMFGLSSPTNAGSSPAQQASLLNTLTNLPSAAVSADPVSQYQAAASLFEQVKLLNRSLRDVPHFTGYTPYIITLQISLIPFRRNAPYDAYSDIAFFTSTNDPLAAQAPDQQTIPMIFPLLTTDALEAANDQRNLDRIRQLGLVINATAHNAGLQAGLDQLNQNLNAVNGYNLNSLLTVGKISQNCMVARLGARNQIGTTKSTSDFSLVPQTHNVSLLVLAPREANVLQMVARTIFRHAIDGTMQKDTDRALRSEYFDQNTLGDYILTQPDQDKLIAKLKDDEYGRLGTTHDRYMWALINDVYDPSTRDSSAFQKFHRDFGGFFGRLAAPQTTNREELINYTNYLQYLHFIKPRRFERFFGNQQMTSYYDEYKHEFDLVWLDSFWLDVTRVGIAEQYANDLIQLPHWMPAWPFSGQTALFSSDDSATTFVLVNDGQNLSTDKITARLTTSATGSTKDEIVLYSHKIDFAGGNLTIHFPPMSLIFPTNSTPITGDPNLKSAWSFTQLDLIYSDEYNSVFPPPTVLSSNGVPIATNQPNVTSYTNFALVNPATKTGSTPDAKAGTPPAWRIARVSGSLAVASSNQFNIVLATNNPEATATNAWFLEVNGPTVITNDSPADGVLGPRFNGIYQLQVSPKCYEVAFIFGPTMSGQSVDFNLLDKDQKVVTNLWHQVVSSNSAPSPSK